MQSDLNQFIADLSVTPKDELEQRVCILTDRIEQQAAEIARLEAERAEQWRLRRERESERDVKSAVIGDLKEEIARLREANGILEDALQEVGDDYPGSSCQELCRQQVKVARAALEVHHGAK